MANEIMIRVRGQDDASKVFDAVTSKAKGFGSTLADVGKIATGFLAANVIAAGASKLTGFFSDSIKQASDLGESVNAVNVIFGKSSNKILEWGRANATSFGLSQRAFNQMATPLGAMLKNTGMDMDEVATHTIDLTKRASDMASVFNTDVEDALMAIQAGLRGELDPLERYGVKLSAAAVEQKALAMTGKEAAKSLTEQEKAAARLALMYEQTNAVAGDFVNTSGDLANAQRIATAKTEELQAEIGQKLLPVTLFITKAKLALVQVIADKVLPAFEKLTEIVGLFVLAIKGGDIGGEFSKIERMAFGLGKTARDFFGDLQNFTGKVKELVDLFMLGLQGGEIGGEFTTIEQAVFDLGQTLRDDVLPALKDVIYFARDELGPAFVTGLDTVAGVLNDTAIPAIKEFFNFILDNKAALIAAIALVGVAIFLALGPVSQAALAITGIIILIGELKRNWEAIKTLIEEGINLPIIGQVGGTGADKTPLGIPTVGSGLEALKNFLGLQHEGGYIGKTGQYLLQRGETVLPASENSRGVASSTTNSRSVTINGPVYVGGGFGGGRNSSDVDLLLGSI